MHYKFEHLVFQPKMIYYTFTKWRSSTSYCFWNKKKTQHTKQSHPYGWKWTEFFPIACQWYIVLFWSQNEVWANISNSKYFFVVSLHSSLCFSFVDIIFFTCTFATRAACSCKARRLSIDMLLEHPKPKLFQLFCFIAMIRAAFSFSFFVCVCTVVTPIQLFFRFNYTK